MRILENLLSVKNDRRYHKVICIMGIKIKINDKIKALEHHIKNLETQLNTIARDNYVFPSRGLTFRYALDNGFVNSHEEHKQNVANLIKNLDDSALQEFNAIYERILLAEEYDKVPIWEFFSPDDLNEIRKAKNIKLHVENKGDYYQYKNYKLPVSRFDYAIFEKKQCLPHIKTLNNLGNKVIIDAGGLLCDTALIMREFTEAPIITFEPVKRHVEYCLKTRELNDIKNLKIENMALGDFVGTTKMYVNTDVPGASNLICENIDCRCEIQECQVETIDNYVKTHNIQVGMIKTDVEGFEFPLLQGAIETIKSQKPILLISIYHNYNDFYKIKPWLESLNLGYKFKIVKDMDENYNLDIYLIAEIY